MSLLDLILDQKIIVISVVIALMPLLIAAGYMIQKSIRQMLRQRKQHQATRARQSLAASAQHSAELFPPEQDETSQCDEPQLSQQAAQAIPDPASTVAVVQPTAGQLEPEKPGQDQAANEIQSLLSSVFADDGADERNRVLLQDTQPIDIRDLAQLCQGVADQLRASVE